MTYPQYLALVNECKNYNSVKAFLAEYGFPADCEWSVEGLIEAMGIIFNVSRNDFAAIVKGKNLSAFCRKYNIPLRSANNWARGESKAPDYVLQMIGFALISECEKEEI